MGNGYVGGLIGYDSDGDYGVSFWDSDVNPDVNGIGNGSNPEVTGLPTVEMHDAFTFSAWVCYGLAWTIDDGNDYPRLAWENKPGELLEDIIYSGGNGTESEPYLIYTARQLNTIGLAECNWDKHFKLMADIDLGDYTETEFNIIGGKQYFKDPPNNKSFTGVFDGDGHKIYNFTYNFGLMGYSYIGLFGHVSDVNGEIRNVGLVDPNVSTVSGGLGSLVGFLEQGSVVGCYVSGGRVSGGSGIGGLVGVNEGGAIVNCYSSVSVSGDWHIGGLVGNNPLGSVLQCYSTGIVTGEGGVGGLAGSNGEDSIISDSYSTGSVTGSLYRIGGLAGSNSGEVLNCYSSSSVTGDVNVGGLIGYDYNFHGDYTASFWDSDVNPDVNGIGNFDEPNVVGLPTVLMQTESTFTDAGWDFVGEVINGPNDIWKMNCEGMSYPKLSWWEPALGDFICPDGVNMFDFAILGDAWFTDPNMPNWDPACDISEPNDNFIDELDLDVFTDNYLTGL